MMMSLKSAALLLSISAAFASQQVETDVRVERDAALQNAIHALLDASSAEQQEHAFDSLLADAGPRHERLVRQLYLFSETSASTREGMLFGVVLERFSIPPTHVIAALVPLLEGAEAQRRAGIGGVLSQFEDRSIDRGANFDAYRPFLSGAAPSGLTRYLFETDPDAALSALVRTNGANQTRDLLWAQHELADLRWQLNFGYLSRADLPGSAAPEHLAQLEFLSRHELWWARLAAVQLVLDEPGLRSAVPLDALAQDAHPVVKELALAAQ